MNPPKLTFKTFNCLCFFMLMFSSQTCHAQDVVNIMTIFFETQQGLEEAKLKGTVKSVQTVFYEVRDNERKRLLKHYASGLYKEFDREGKTTAFYVYRDRPPYFPFTHEELNKLEYHPNGNLKKEIRPFNSSYLVYNEDGREIATYYFEDSGYILVDTTEYDFDDEGRVIGYNTYDPSEGKLAASESMIIKYDENGHIMEEYIGGGNLNMNIWKSARDYSLIKYEHDEDGKLLSFHLDTEGLVGNHDVKNTYEDGELVHTLTKKSGKKIEEYFVDGKLDRRVLFDTDMRYTIDSKLIYKYDDEGNWTSISIYVANIPQRGEENTDLYQIDREITYYD